MRFSGRVSTVKCFENNPLVRKVSTPAHLLTPSSCYQCTWQRSSTHGQTSYQAFCHQPQQWHSSPLQQPTLLCVSELYPTRTHTRSELQAFEQPGNGRVLVVDGGGSKRCALLGDNIAEMAYKNGWSVSPCTAPTAPAASQSALWQRRCRVPSC